MLNDVLGRYFDDIEEREFDAPFMALLRGIEYKDIHFLHGTFEFGKDFIAKRTDSGVTTQYAFQTKAGSIDLGAWNKLRGQIDLLRTNVLAHPNFDSDLPRCAVLVTTGRLVGGAPLAAQDYNKHLIGLGEIGFEVWDRETLLSFLETVPEVGLVGSFQAGFLGLIASIDMGQATDRDVEKHSRSWAKEDESIWRSLVEATIIAQRLRNRDRLDLSCFTVMTAIRAIWHQEHGAEPPSAESITASGLARVMFRQYASSLRTALEKTDFKPEMLIPTRDGQAAYVTYPVRCLRGAEMVALLGLLLMEDDKLEAEEVTNQLCKFLSANPGVAHPISDRYAVSLIPIILLLSKFGRTAELDTYVRAVIKWVADRYDNDSVGLAASDASPQEEVNRLLGSCLEHIQLDRRPECYVATVILDLLSILGMGELYELAINDFLAVKAMPPILEVGDGLSQYALDGVDLRYEANAKYEVSWSPTDKWKVAPHHHRSPSSYYLGRISKTWDHLAVSAVLRDRHFLPSCQQILSASYGK
jgi:hypothetical protein